MNYKLINTLLCIILLLTIANCINIVRLELTVKDDINNTYYSRNQNLTNDSLSVDLKGLYKCHKCGSFNVFESLWINPNNDEMISMDEDGFYCDDCQEFTTLDEYNINDKCN